MVLGERLAQELKELYTQLNNDEELLSKAQLEGYYETFRKRFGPAQLKAVDGEALLEFMHDHGNHDSLVYWIEFKNDEEYRRKETGAWMTGHTLDQREIPPEEAIQSARKHWDQLILGTQLLE
jgi:5-methylcytosine-specific restriction enzyme B